MSMIDPTTSSTPSMLSQNQSTTAQNPMGQLDPNSFLQLLVAQMQNQDPLQPTDDSQMLGQLAQFSSVEQMTNVATDMQSELSAINNLSTLTEVSVMHQLLGSNVQVTDSSGQTVSGSVSSVSMSGSEPSIVVNGQSYPLSSISSMS